MDLTQFVAAGGIIGLFSASAVVLFRVMSYEATITQQFQGQVDSLNEELDEVKADRARCIRVNSLLITTLQRNNIEVPPEGWL